RNRFRAGRYLFLPDNAAGIVNDTNCRSFLRYIERGKGRHGGSPSIAERRLTRCNAISLGNNHPPSEGCDPRAVWPASSEKNLTPFSPNSSGSRRTKNSSCHAERCEKTGSVLKGIKRQIFFGVCSIDLSEYAITAGVGRGPLAASRSGAGHDCSPVP